MATENLEIHYRELNVSYGVLEALHRLRYELASQARKDSKRRICGALLLLAAAIPAIYGLLPDNARKEFWIAPSVVLGIIYLCLCVYEIRQQPVAIQKLDAFHNPEDNPRFLSLLLNSYATRWQVVQEIVSKESDAAARESYMKLANYYRRAMLSIVPQIDQIVSAGKLSPERRIELLSFIPNEFRPSPDAESGDALQAVWPPSDR